VGDLAAEYAAYAAGAEDADVVDLIFNLRIHSFSFRFYL
jgi:hypothetical protein